jgi:hypothetical protein
MPDFLEELSCKGKKKCRISWKSLTTDFKSHGDWFNLTDEQTLQRRVNEMNIKYAGVLTHWLEYQ